MYPHHPPCPTPPAGFLAQKIIAFERRHMPLVNAEWCFQPCMTGVIQSVTACGAPTWTLLSGCRVRITLPVCVRLCDPCGSCTTQLANMEVETELPRAFLSAINDPRCTLLILPRVRLLRVDQPCGSCFRVQLTVSLDLYLLRYEAMGCPNAPQCPQLPLYPQPMC